MALVFQPFEVIFRGLGEHSDPKTQLPGTLETCKDAVFDKRGRIAKRRGFGLVPVLEDIEGDAIDPSNLLVNAASIHGELVVFGYDVLFGLVSRTTAFGSGRLVPKGPTFRGNVEVLHVATAGLPE